jgi:hypothetical protein
MPASRFRSAAPAAPSSSTRAGGCLRWRSSTNYGIAASAVLVVLAVLERFGPGAIVLLWGALFDVGDTSGSGGGGVAPPRTHGGSPSSFSARGGGGAGIGPAVLADRPRPNVLFLMSDQHRWDALGAAGNSIVRTPHLDRLAAEGTHFLDATTYVPTCVPARAAILTGSVSE